MSAKLVFNLENAARVKNAKGYERDILSLFEENGVKKVSYRVKKHSRKRLIGETFTVSRKAFVDWLDGIQINKDEFTKGDIIEYGEFRFEVLKNNGAHGKVKCVKDGFILDKFYWRGCSDERCFKVNI